MVNTVKFSQFNQANLATTTNKLVGIDSLTGGSNVYTSLFNKWTTATRPSPPSIGMYGYNTDLPSLESFNGFLWVPVGSGGFGTVSEVNTGTGLTGGPITSTGTISFASIAANSLWANVNSMTAVPTVIPTSTFLISANNLSDLPNMATARTNLGLVIGTNVEAWNAQLDQIASGVWPGASSITTVGNISSGIWSATNIPLSKGGTNASLTATNGGIVYSTASALAISAALTNGQLLIGNTGNIPSVATLTAGDNISIVNSAGTITIAGTGLAGFSWNMVTGTSQAMLPNNGYFANNAALVTLTLPATSAVGDEIDIMGIGAGGWKVQAGTGQTIVMGSVTTASAGSIASTNSKDSLYLICTVANTQWEVGSGAQGNITIGSITNNAVNSPLSGTTGTGNFVGSISPTFTNLQISGGIYDVNTNAYLTFQSPVGTITNNIKIFNANTGSPPIIESLGAVDVNVLLQLKGQGNSGVGIQGKTSGSASAAGNVGEFVSNQVLFASGTALTSTQPKNVTSISLTAGDWDVWGNIFISDTLNTLSVADAWISLTSATLPDSSLVASMGANVAVLTFWGARTPDLRVNITSTTTVFLSASATFASGSVTACGGIYARRVA